MRPAKWYTFQLKSWYIIQSLNTDDNSFNNFVELVYNYYNDLTGKRKEFKTLDDETIKKIIDWIRKNSTVLENGFFHYESKDKKFAEKISATLYVFERITLTDNINE